MKTSTDIFNKHFDETDQEEDFLLLRTKPTLKEEIISAMEEYASQPKSQPKGETKVQWTKASKKHPPINKMVVIKEDGVLSLDSTTIGWDKRITNYEWLEELPHSHSIEPRQEVKSGWEDDHTIKQLHLESAELSSLKTTIFQSPLKKYFPEREMSFHDKVLFAIHDVIAKADSPLNKEEIVRWLEEHSNIPIVPFGAIEYQKGYKHALSGFKRYILSLPSQEEGG